MLSYALFFLLLESFLKYIRIIWSLISTKKSLCLLLEIIYIFIIYIMYNIYYICMYNAYVCVICIYVIYMYYI